MSYERLKRGLSKRIICNPNLLQCYTDLKKILTGSTRGVWELQFKMSLSFMYSLYIFEKKRRKKLISRSVGSWHGYMEIIWIRQAFLLVNYYPFVICVPYTAHKIPSCYRKQMKIYSVKHPPELPYESLSLLNLFLGEPSVWWIFKL